MLFGVSRLLAPAESDATHAIVITTEHISELRRNTLEHSGHTPTAAELEALVDAAVTEEILYREALRHGLDENDAVVERRLVQNMRFVSDDPSRDAPTLLRQAHAAGLQRGDPVIRRRLVQKMQMILESDGNAGEPTDPQLRSYFTAHAADFTTTPSVKLTHIFYDGPNPGSEAGATLEELRRLDVAADAAADHGDAFPAGTTLPPHSQHGLAKLFGDAFAETCMTLPVGTWSGPVFSPYGAHLVWIHERIPGQVPPFETVRSSVRERILAERADNARRAGVARLRQTYAVTVEAFEPE